MAGSVRDGVFTQQAAPDLLPLQEGLADNRVIYRYIPRNSCAVQERCVGGTGWRRLLQFSASVRNQGRVPVVGGDTSDGSPYRVNNIYEFSACHGHFHFSHYGTFGYGNFPGEKRAFCLESTSRYFNNEQTPIRHPYNCHTQGIESGWGDDYIAGIECQWIDVTATQGTAANLPLKFQSNPDGFLCEGTLQKDASGAQLFEPTSFVTEGGQPVNRPVCAVASGTEASNFAQRTVALPASGGFTTQPCTRGQTGPLRDCGFKQGPVRTCSPGQSVTLTCTAAKPRIPPQVVRVCEASKVLGVGTSCVFRDALASQVVQEGGGTTVTFTCPDARDVYEPGGRFALYTAPVVDGDASSVPICN